MEIRTAKEVRDEVNQAKKARDIVKNSRIRKDVAQRIEKDKAKGEIVVMAMTQVVKAELEQLGYKVDHCRAGRMGDVDSYSIKW